MRLPTRKTRWRPSQASHASPPRSLMPPGQLGHGGAATDGGHGALVAVAERLGGLAVGEPGDLAGDVAPGLHGHRRELGQEVAVLVRCRGDVADGPRPVAPGDAQVGLHHDAAAAALLEAEPVGQRVGLHPGRPHEGVAGQHLAVRERDRGRGHLGHGGAEAHLDAAAGERVERVLAAAGGERVEQVVLHLDEHDAGGGSRRGRGSPCGTPRRTARPAPRPSRRRWGRRRRRRR